MRFVWFLFFFGCGFRIFLWRSRECSRVKRWNNGKWCENICFWGNIFHRKRKNCRLTLTPRTTNKTKTKNNKSVSFTNISPSLRKKIIRGLKNTWEKKQIQNSKSKEDKKTRNRFLAAQHRFAGDLFFSFFSFFSLSCCFFFRLNNKVLAADERDNETPERNYIIFFFFLSFI